MLLIPCPHCGPREESEFSYGGPLRPLPSLCASLDTAQDALYHPINPCGPIQELWFHAGGCGCWITVTRNTVTHAFHENTQ